MLRSFSIGSRYLAGKRAFVLPVEILSAEEKNPALNCAFCVGARQ